jgi:hypothetical protein
VRREFMPLLPMVLHDTLGSYLGDALYECGAASVACLPAPRAQASVPIFFSALLEDSTTFFVINAC